MATTAPAFATPRSIFAWSSGERVPSGGAGAFGIAGNAGSPPLAAPAAANAPNPPAPGTMPASAPAPPAKAPSPPALPPSAPAMPAIPPRPPAMPASAPRPPGAAASSSSESIYPYAQRPESRLKSRRTVKRSNRRTNRGARIRRSFDKCSVVSVFYRSTGPWSHGSPPVGDLVTRDGWFDLRSRASLLAVIPNGYSSNG